jgi:hypothetical protein
VVEESKRSIGILYQSQRLETMRAPRGCGSKKLHVNKEGREMELERIVTSLSKEMLFIVFSKLFLMPRS